MSIIPTTPHAQYEREKFRRNSHFPELWLKLDEVKDPEIPVLSLWDMGILKDIHKESNNITVTITPTYSGCPAMDVITEDIQKAFELDNNNDIYKCVVKIELSPAWTTDWMTEKGRNQLRGYGIAPPNDVVNGELEELTSDTQVLCPHCHSKNTHMVSEFGSTACKALFQCNDCSEPFDLFKHI
ncbi:1,2-phenylacetyl-CoA epoxidase subunit PaaD [Pseudocolwellia sp. HL-MZ19]|uniref:1,2-phenylacetyl-CoA epoxidase subunit PaaD n=1 Tax=Pseudocolwellia sp. HL-MZ19 TaxID=3400846 RepID=UPI003CF735C1